MSKAKRLDPLRIAAVDDHPREEALLRELFDPVSDMELVAFFTTHRDLLRAWDDVGPQIVLLDVRRRPPPNEYTAETRPWDEFAEVAAKDALTFAISHSQEARDIVAAGQAGAVGYLLKHEGEEIVDRIRQIARGNVPDPTFDEARAYLSEFDDLEERLTPREFEVVHAIADGLHPPEIARRWNIDSRTVNAHVASIRRKLGVHGYGAIGAWAARHGIV